MKREARLYFTGKALDSESYQVVPDEMNRAGIAINDLEVEVDLDFLELKIRDSATLQEFLSIDLKVFYKTIYGVINEK